MLPNGLRDSREVPFFISGDLYKYLEATFPAECDSAGVTVSDGKPHHESDARYAIRDSKDRGIIKHARKGRWKKGYWQRT
jgi:hypothetical protein